jgi:hypothetical protein
VAAGCTWIYFSLRQGHSQQSPVSIMRSAQYVKHGEVASTHQASPLSTTWTDTSQSSLLTVSSSELCKLVRDRGGWPRKVVPSSYSPGSRRSGSSASLQIFLSLPRTHHDLPFGHCRHRDRPQAESAMVMHCPQVLYNLQQCAWKFHGHAQPRLANVPRQRGEQVAVRADLASRN